MRNRNDFYPTPESVVALIMREIWDDVTQVWEPCAGDGRLVEAMERRGMTVFCGDIVTGQDFFDAVAAPCPTLVTNPPFRPIRKFIDHSFEIGVQRMLLVCPERLWACGRGSEQWQRHRPSRFVNMSFREDYLGRGGSPDRMLAVSIWDRPHSETCRYEIWDRNTYTEMYPTSGQENKWGKV